MGSSQELEMQTCGKIGKNCMVCLGERDILVEVEHVKAHHTKKEKTHMSQCEKIVTEGSEKADELAKAGAMLDEGFMAEARAETMKQERERRCMQLCSMRSASIAW